MRKLVASTPQAEIKGVILKSLFQCIKYDELSTLLKKYDLESLDTEEWYPQQLLLDIYKDIAEQNVNVSENLVSIGMKIMEAAAFPPMINSVEDALSGLHFAYNADHRYHTETGWIVELAGPGKALMTADNPYPDDQHYGLLWGLVKRFSPQGTRFTVIRMLQEDPDANTVFEIKWDA